MTEKQKIFADKCIDGFEIEKAYKLAYPSVKSDEKALSLGKKLLEDIEIKEYIEKGIDDINISKTADAKEVIEYLTAIVRGQETEEVIVKENHGRGYSSATTIDKKISVRDRIKAAELLGKRYSLFTDKVQLDSSALIQIIDDIPDDIDV